MYIYGTNEDSIHQCITPSISGSEHSCIKRKIKQSVVK